MEKIRLTETQLRNLIAESVKKVIKEYDEPFPYDYKDAREREAYYQRAVKHDFPRDAQFKTGRSWEDMYNSLVNKKAAADKDRQKAEKLKARDEKKRAAAEKKMNAIKSRDNKNVKWAAAVKDVFVGSDNEKDNYDGISSFPLVLKDRSTVMFNAHSFMKVDDAFANEEPSQFAGYGSQPFDSFTFGLGGTVDGIDENVELYMTVGTYVSPMTVEVTNLKCNLDNVYRLRTKIAISELAKKEAVKRYKKLMKNDNNQ